MAFSLLGLQPGSLEEQVPVAPPRRKRKKKLFEKQASLEDLDVRHYGNTNSRVQLQFILSGPIVKPP